jgi:hypothetical protein
MQNTTAQSLVQSIPGTVLEIFGDAPILSTEDAARYHAMIAAFAEHVDPGDFITWCTITRSYSASVGLPRGARRGTRPIDPWRASPRQS